MSERQTTGEFTNYRIGERSGKTYNKIQEMAKEIVRLQEENEQLKEENFDQVYMKAIADYKEKIRNKISQIDEEYSKTLEKELSLEFYNINAQRHAAMKMVLEELLGE